MDKFSIVPNQFFDLIARVIPGAVLIFALEYLGGPNLLTKVTRVFVPPSLEAHVVPWLVMAVALTYALGHALSPGVKWLEWAGKACRKTAWYKGKHKDSEALFREETERYNRLRFKHPARVTYATRIRAESTMYGGIAVALGVAELFSIGPWVFGWLRAWSVHSNVRPVLQAGIDEHGIGMVVLVGMIFRYFDVHRRFCQTINAFEEASRSSADAPVAADPP